MTGAIGLVVPAATGIMPVLSLLSRVVAYLRWRVDAAPVRNVPRAPTTA